MNEPTCNTCRGPNRTEYKNCSSCRARRAAYMRDYYHRDVDRSRESNRSRYHSGGEICAVCSYCREAFNTSRRMANRAMGRTDRLFCSGACKNAYRNEVARVTRREIKARAAKMCPHCGSTLDASLRSDASFCSGACNSAAHQATRKAKMKVRAGARVVRVDRAYIVDRDGGRCHLCGKKPSPDQLHIDHVIPLSRGGDHTLENLRVACAKCNLSKRADARNEQLMLVG